MWQLQTAFFTNEHSHLLWQFALFGYLGIERNLIFDAIFLSGLFFRFFSIRQDHVPTHFWSAGTIILDLKSITSQDFVQDLGSLTYDFLVWDKNIFFHPTI